MSRSPRAWIVAVGAVMVCATTLPRQSLAQVPAPPETAAKAVVAKAVAYLGGYKETLQFVLCDEVASQDVFNRLGQRAAHRETSGEFFLTYLAADGGWVGVRDIAVVDGVPIETRDNLRALLTKASFARIGRQLADRNARYNIGSISRNVNDPMMALLVLDDRHRNRFTFKRRRVEPTPTGPLVTVTFTERDAPTLVRGADGRPIFAKGDLVIDAATGRLVRTVITWKDGRTTGTLTTVFTENEKMGLWLPASLTEEYDHQADRLEEKVRAHSTYTNYRRFNVDVKIR